MFLHCLFSHDANLQTKHFFCLARILKFIILKFLLQEMKYSRKKKVVHIWEQVFWCSCFCHIFGGSKFFLMIQQFRSLTIENGPKRSLVNEIKGGEEEDYNQKKRGCTHSHFSWFLIFCKVETFRLPAQILGSSYSVFSLRRNRSGTSPESAGIQNSWINCRQKNRNWTIEFWNSMHTWLSSKWENTVLTSLAQKKTVDPIWREKENGPCHFSWETTI